MKPEIQTHSGSFFNFLEPEKYPLDVGDIAHALSHICRFGGHTKDFYSVAQHSVYVARCLPKDKQLQGLFHDATESVLGDIPTPLKQPLPDYKAIEKNVERCIMIQLGLPVELDPLVKHYDRVLLVTEQRDIMTQCADPLFWKPQDGVYPREERIIPWGPILAKRKFLDLYYELIRGSL